MRPLAGPFALQGRKFSMVLHSFPVANWGKEAISLVHVFGESAPLGFNVGDVRSECLSECLEVVFIHVGWLVGCGLSPPTTPLAEFYPSDKEAGSVAILHPYWGRSSVLNVDSQLRAERFSGKPINRKRTKRAFALVR